MSLSMELRAHVEHARIALAQRRAMTRDPREVAQMENCARALDELELAILLARHKLNRQ